MKKQILSLAFTFMAFSMMAQSFQEISVGAGYNNQSFVRLADDFQSQSPNDAWDIAFTVDAFGAGIFINESAGSSMGQAFPAIELYDAQSEDFSATPDPTTLDAFRLHNAEDSWAYGAFNENRDPSDFADFGWGAYSDGAVTGAKVYVVKLRDGSYKKMQIGSLAGGIFNFKYADLDGSNEATKTITKADHPNKAFAYFSFTTEGTVDVEPESGSFDFVYCRYTTPLDDGMGGVIQYTVTGILSGPGVEVAEGAGVDVDAADYADHEGNLSSVLNTVGHDWKSFTGMGWDIPSDRVYFVRTAEDRVWKVQFIDFEGSSSGTAVLQKEDLGIISNIEGENSPLTSFDVYPNPVQSEANLVFSLKNAGRNAARLRLVNPMGQIVLQNNLQTVQGLNSYTLPVEGLSAGIYYLHLEVDGNYFTETILISR